MELVNVTRMEAAYTLALEPTGRELLVVAVKGTFDIPLDGGAARLADKQIPLAMADNFVGAPGASAPLYEADFAPGKIRCDVLLHGNAHAPKARPTTRVVVGLRVGRMTKTFQVVGDRHWSSGLSGSSASEPEPFVRMPVSYDRAFGGVDDRHSDPARHVAFMRNPVGRGFHALLHPEWVDGSPLPNTEALNQPVQQPDSSAYLPMAFGPIGRGWDPRYRYAGTYDDRWLAEEFPFLPSDFDPQYYQAAPLDQQIPHPRGGEDVRLVNLTEHADIGFTLPVFDAQVEFHARRGGAESSAMQLDTVYLEPEDLRLTLTWRAVRPLRRDIFELAQILIGRRPQVWWAESKPVPLIGDDLVPPGDAPLA